MPRENRKSLPLTYSDFDIAGNVFRAWHDADGNLVFVVDETIDEYKPNVMLVLNPGGERKWDDILVNDYDMDLEDVRPKKDNKYQKLDIEYEGLDIYDALIHAYSDGDDVDNAVADLIDFRDAAVRRAATARLNAALETIAQSNETVLRANKSLTALREQQKKLRNRLAHQKENIGREPTKESAAKILRTESRLEANTEKLARAQLRLDNAKRRIETANADAEAARELLARRRPGIKKSEAGDSKVVRAQTKKQNVARSSKPVVSENSAPETDEENNQKNDTGILPVPNYDFQQKEDKMPDSEEVKPLFDKDPEILDDEIAFKPVEFDDIKSESEFDERKLHRPHSESVGKSHSESDTEYTESAETEQTHDYVSDDAVGAENEYSKYESNRLHDEETHNDVARPLDFSQNDSEYETERNDVRPVEPEPVLETITSVEKSVPSDVDTTGQVDNTQYAASAATMTRPLSPASMAASAPATAPTRPISPITGNEPVRPVGESHSKPTFAYYLLLILLIALSIFTLWLYQKKNGASLPSLDMAPENMINTSASPETPSADGAPVEPDSSVDVVIESGPDAELDVPVIVPEYSEKPIEVRYPNEDVLRAAEPDKVVVESEESVLSRKDPYYVSRDDQVVYVPVEPISEPEPETEVRVTNVTAPSVIYDDELVSVPVPAPEYDDAEYYYEDTAAVYQPADAQSTQNNYPEYNEYSGGFVDNGTYTEQYKEQQYYDESGPTMRRQVDAHDGGQYSIIYDETTY